jgi:Icc-related predicted phosphoesterase
MANNLSENKMKIAICSDVHLEFGQLEIKNEQNADVLILSGDICVARDLMLPDPHGIVDFGKSKRYHEFFDNCAREFANVVYIVGNHEHYHGDFADTIPHIRKCLAHNANIHVLDKEIFEIDDVVFIGGTLWTDMNKEDPMTLHAITRMMNDFRCVENSNRVVNYKVFEDTENPDKPTFKTRTARFTPEDAVEDHKKMLDYIRIIYEQTAPWKTVVVVGHHTPSNQSCHPMYKDDQLMNGGYHSDLSEFILDRPGIKLWTHGHTHEDFDYMIGKTRVVCNPRGYFNYEARADKFQLKVVEV